MSREEHVIKVFSEPAAAGFTASNVGGPTYQALLARGAAISDHRPGKPAEFKTRAYNMDEDMGGMVVVDLNDPNVRPQITVEDAPVVQLEGGRTMVPVKTEVAPPIIPNIPMTESSADDQITNSISAAINGKAAARPVALAPVHSVTFITPMGEFEFPCFFIGREEQWITLIGPKFPKVNAGVNIDLKISGKTLSCYSPGINVEIKLGEHTARMANFLVITNEP